MQHRTSSPTTSGFWCDQIPQTGTHDNWMPGFPLCSDSSVLRPDGTFGQSSTTCSEKRARRGTLARSAAQGTSSHCGFALCIGVPYTPQFRWRLRSITRMPMRSRSLSAHELPCQRQLVSCFLDHGRAAPAHNNASRLQVDLLSRRHCRGFDAIVFFATFCVWSEWFPHLAIAFAALCFISATARLVLGWKMFLD